MLQKVALALSALLIFGDGAIQGEESLDSNAAFLFAYDPKPGMEAHFREGYRRHLEWHRERRDSLVWYGWFVTSGQRLGLFVDGTFGLPFSAMDRRVDPAGDFADFAQAVAPFAEPVFRQALILRSDLSTGRLLEERKPTPMVIAVRYRIHSGMEERFEAVLRRLREASSERDDDRLYTWYELVIGGEHPSYLLMIPAAGFSDLGSPTTVSRLLAAVLPSAEAATLQEELSQTVASAVSETWSYQSELSYFPTE